MIPPRQSPAPVDSYAQTRVAVLGGLGFIGSNLARRLIDVGARVRVIDALLPGFGGDRRNLAGREDRCEVDIRDARDPGLTAALAGSAIVMNAIGQVSHHRSLTDPHTDLAANADAQLSILEACRQLDPSPVVVYAGTRQIYGRARELPVTESVAAHPVDINGVNKFAGEEYHRIFHEVYGLRTVRLRLTNTYGPRQSLRAASQGVIPTFVRRALTGLPLQVFGTGAQRRDLTYVDDVVEAFLAVARTPAAYGGVFNLGSDRPATVYEIAQAIAAVADVPVERVPFPEELKTIEIGDSWSSYDRLERATGWKPVIPLADGVARTLGFFREHPAYWRNA